MSFNAALAFTLDQEGGWYDGSKPSDPNPTYKGVRQDTYNRYRAEHGLAPQSVQLIGPTELNDLYFGYWTDARCAALGMLSGLVVFDHAVNRGPANGIRIVQVAAGTTPDGQWGALTAAAVAAVSDTALASRLLWARLADYYQVAEANPSERPDLPAWLGRVLACRKAVLAAGG